ncbi:CAF17-like 4Fe-4S cluster assembly/insertion protein YgfZ [Wolbachia endosymbiont of Pentidionis agamae]|uniref:CAF17-like 4Fe-4S cluster assembly/insertion protein YgfZ n=1 Tax=Wolbachia endosymbiont of Pentidionis agamae TaxID=3110435 RepID=UPI002FD75A02
MNNYVLLPNRGVLKLSGPDVRGFLQDVITNNINKLNIQKAVYSLLLNPQGKYLYDFFLIENGKNILLECESIYINGIVERLNLLKTYLRVKIQDVSKLYKVGVSLNSDAVNINELQITFQDPRHVNLGFRIISPIELCLDESGNLNDYEYVRISNLIPDGIRDMVQNVSFPLQYLIDKVNGIDFNKGCYIGQEVVTRMSRQQSLRRKLYLVSGENDLPIAGTKIIKSDEEIGELRSSIKNIGLALLYTEKASSENDSLIQAKDVNILIK